MSGTMVGSPPQAAAASKHYGTQERADRAPLDRDQAFLPAKTRNAPTPRAAMLRINGM
jgi:hypothetical protein